MAPRNKVVEYIHLKTTNPKAIVPSYTPPKSPQNDPGIQSLLLALPLEIRILIYQYIVWSFGWGDAVHIVTRSLLNRASPTPWMSNERDDTPHSNELACVPCAAEIGDHCQISGTHYGQWPRGHLACERIASWRTASPSDGPMKPRDFEYTSYIALFLTCRQIYSEASDYLYSTIRFEPLGLEAAHRFLHGISPRLLARMSKLHLSWQTVTPIPPIPENVSELERTERLDNNRDRFWVEICSRIRQMKGLRELRIGIYDVTSRSTPEDDLLEPLMHIHVNGSFIVELRSVEGANVEDIFNGDAPFRVERRGRELDDGVGIGMAIQNGGRRRRRRRVFCLCLPFMFVYYAVKAMVNM